MKVTCLYDLESSRNVVPTLDGLTRVVVNYARSPNADELIAIYEVSRFNNFLTEPIPFNLKPIGTNSRNPFYWICSRTDCGPFWRIVAVIKYKILIASNWLQDQLIRCLYSLGMLNWRRYEEVDLLKDVRWDWQLLLHLSYALFTAVQIPMFILSGHYLVALFYPLMVAQGCIFAFLRRKQLVEIRDREIQEANLRGFFRLHDITPTEDEFARCMLGLLEANQVVSMHRAWRDVVRAETQSTHPCFYYIKSDYLKCAVHPDYHTTGMCNTECPSFMPKDNQQKI